MGLVIGQSVFGQISGKVGQGVGVNWRGMFIVRSLPLIQDRKSSNKQLLQRALFKAVNDFLTCVPTEIFNMGFQLGKGSKLSPMNSAASYHMLNAVERVGDEWVLDFDKLKFSKPIRSISEEWSCVIGEVNGGIKVSWEPDPFPEKTTQPDDEAIIICYNAGKKDFKSAIDLSGVKDPVNVRRSDLNFVLPATKTTAGYDIDFWIFFVSEDKKRVSETMYLGMLTMPDLQS